MSFANKEGITMESRFGWRQTGSEATGSLFPYLVDVRTVLAGWASDWYSLSPYPTGGSSVSGADD